MPHKYFLYLQALRKVTRDFPRQQMHGKPTRIPVSQLRRTKKESACTGFNISFLRIFKSLLTDSNNQDTRSHTSASSTSFLKDSSYWLLICCQPGPWNKPESVQETFRKRLGSMRWLQAGPGIQEVRPLTAGIHEGVYIPTHPKEIARTGQPWRKESMRTSCKAVRAHATELSQTLQSGERTVQWVISIKFHPKLKPASPD